MECVAIGAELIAMAGAADRRRLHAEIRRGGLDDAVGGVAIRADRRAGIAGGDCLAVDSLLILLVDADVAAATGSWDVGAVR